MLVKDIMVKEVKTVEAKATVQDAAKKMAEFDIGSLIVTDGDRLAGIITERDIIRKISALGKSSVTFKVKDVMSKEVIMVKPETELMEAVDIMEKKRTKKLPVVSGNKLVGIVTLTDMCTAQPRMIDRVTSLLIGDEKKQKRLVAG